MKCVRVRDAKSSNVCQTREDSQISNVLRKLFICYHPTKPFGNVLSRSTFDLFVQAVWHGPTEMAHMLSTVCGFQYSTVSQIAFALIFDKSTRHVKVASAKLSIMIANTLWNKVHMLQALT